MHQDDRTAEFQQNELNIENVNKTFFVFSIKIELSLI